MEAAGPYGPHPAQRLSQEELRQRVTDGHQILRQIQDAAIGFQQLLTSLPADKQTSVKQLIDKLPKQMNVQSLLREVRARYQQLENAKGVFQKYKDFSEKDQIPPQLRSSASMQWPHFYLACAAPVAHEHDMEFQQDNASYKVDVRFQDLVKSHQRSQREFILLHSTQCLQTAEDRVSLAAFQALADELVYNHCEIFVGEIPDQQVAAKRRDLTATLYALVALLREQQVFAMKSRADKEAKKRQKREDELAKAELAWEALPPAVLVGLAAHQESGGGPARKAQGQERIAVGNNPVLKRLLMPHEDQLKELGFILDTSSQPSSAAPKQRSRPPSTGSTSSAGRGRGKGKTPSQPSSAGPKQRSRPSSAGSASSAGRGKGKGKSKGRGKGTGKGQSKGGQGKSKNSSTENGRGGSRRTSSVRFQ